MKRIKVSLACIAMILILMLSACSGTPDAPADSPDAPPAAPQESTPQESAPTQEANETLEAVELKLVLLGDSPTDAERVYEAINERLMQEISTTVSVQFLSWADYLQRYPLVLASGDYDLIASANWSDYFKHARNGAFLELTDELLQQYAPQTLVHTPQKVFDSAMVDGKLYNLPMNYNEITIDGYIVRGDLREKYGVPEIKTLYDFGVYLEAIKQNEPDMIPWDVNAYDIINFLKYQVVSDAGYYQFHLANMIAVTRENNPTVFPLTEVPGFADFARTMKEFNDAGYWSRSALVNTTPARDSFVAGRSAAFTDNLLQASATFAQLAVSNPDWELEFHLMINNATLIGNPFINNGVAINAQTAHADRALMVLDLFRNDEWFNQTTTYGIYGVHWEKSADGKLVSLPDSMNFPPDSACPWGWRDARFYLAPANTFPNYVQLMEQAMNMAPDTNFNSFEMNKEDGNMQSLDVTLAEVFNQYVIPLALGFSNNIDEDIANIIRQAEAAGIQEYIETLQRQVDEAGLYIREVSP